MSIQKRNAQIVSLLSSDFLRLTDPARTRISTANVSNPPTSAELSTAFDTPANLPDGFIGLVNDVGAGVTMWLVVADGTSWWYEQLTKAV